MLTVALSGDGVFQSARVLMNDVRVDESVETLIYQIDAVLCRFGVSALAAGSEVSCESTHSEGALQTAPLQ